MSEAVELVEAADEVRGVETLERSLGHRNTATDRMAEVRRNLPGNPSPAGNAATGKQSNGSNGADPEAEAEITRLVDLGAERVADKDEWGHAWTVRTDPEGNEFCVSRVTRP